MLTLVIDGDGFFRLTAHCALGPILTASTIEDGVKLAAHWQPPVVLLDGAVPKLAETISELRRFAPEAQVIVLTADKARQREALNLGARGVIGKGSLAKISEMVSLAAAACASQAARRPRRAKDWAATLN